MLARGFSSLVCRESMMHLCLAQYLHATTVLHSTCCCVGDDRVEGAALAAVMGDKSILLPTAAGEPALDPVC